MILYGSRYGSVREYAGWVREAGEKAAAGEGGDTTPFRTFDLRKERGRAWDAVRGGNSDEPIVVLAPVYAGQIYSAVKSFLEMHMEEIRRHPLALGITTLYQGEQAEEEMIAGYPPALIAHASARFFIGGRIRPNELPFFIRLVVKKITGNDEEIDTLNRDAIPDIVAWIRGASGSESPT